LSVIQDDLLASRYFDIYQKLKYFLHDLVIIQGLIGSAWRIIAMHIK